MKKALCILVLMAMILCAGCGKIGPEGPKVYSMGSVWESDGGKVSVHAYFVLDHWENADGSVVTPEEGKNWWALK